MNDNEARRLAADLTDIEIERLEYALQQERQSRRTQPVAMTQMRFA